MILLCKTLCEYDFLFCLGVLIRVEFQGYMMSVISTFFCFIWDRVYDSDWSQLVSLQSWKLKLQVCVITPRLGLFSSFSTLAWLFVVPWNSIWILKSTCSFAQKAYKDNEGFVPHLQVFLGSTDPLQQSSAYGFRLPFHSCGSTIQCFVGFSKHTSSVLATCCSLWFGE